MLRHAGSVQLAGSGHVREGAQLDVQRDERNRRHRVWEAHAPAAAVAAAQPGAGAGVGPGWKHLPPEYGNCECYCGDNPVGNIDVDDRQGGVGVTQSFCEDNMRDQCPDEGFTCDGGDLTVSWSYVSTYTGANFGGGTYDGPAPSPDPGSGGGTSDELGDCSCFCDADLTDFAGNVNVCDGNGGDCGVTSAQCSSLGPDQGCPSSAMSDDDFITHLG